MTQVLVDSVENDRRLLNLPDDGVAAAAQHSTDSTCVVAVVDHQEAGLCVTQEAPATLKVAHLLEIANA